MEIPLTLGCNYISFSELKWTIALVTRLKVHPVIFHRLQMINKSALQVRVSAWRNPGGEQLQLSHITPPQKYLTASFLGKFPAATFHQHFLYVNKEIFKILLIVSILKIFKGNFPNEHLAWDCLHIPAAFSWWITRGRTAWIMPGSSWNRSQACCPEWRPLWGWTSMVRSPTLTRWSWWWSACGSTTRLISSLRGCVRKHCSYHLDMYYTWFS